MHARSIVLSGLLFLASPAAFAQGAPAVTVQVQTQAQPAPVAQAVPAIQAPVVAAPVAAITSNSHHDLCHVNPGGILPPDHAAKCDKRKAKAKAKKKVYRPLIVVGTVVDVESVGDGYAERRQCEGEAPEAWELEGRTSEEGIRDFNGYTNGYRIYQGRTYGSFYGSAYDDMLEEDRAAPQRCWTERTEVPIKWWDVTLRSDSGVMYIKRANFAPRIGDRVRVVNPKRLR